MGYMEMPTATAVPVATEGFGGDALAAGVGALAGAWLGNGIGGFGRGAAVAEAVSNETLLQGQAQLRYEVPAQTIAMQGMISGLQGDICAADRDIMAGIAATNLASEQAAHNNAQQTLALGNQVQVGFAGAGAAMAQAKYDTSMQINNLQHNQDMCCCETKLLITTQGYEAQLREQANFNTLQNGQTEIKCLIKDTAKDAELRAAYAKIAEMSQCAQTNAIIGATSNGFIRQGNAINTLGINDKIINPATIWPPYNPGFCGC